MGEQQESPFRSSVLSGKVALVTGGGSGICFEIATQFGLHGAHVAIMGRRKHVLDAAVTSLESLNIKAIGLQGGVRKKEDASRVVEATVSALGRLDIRINALLAIFSSQLRISCPTVMDIDALGTFTMSHAALHYLKKGGKGKGPTEGGVIISISATLHYSANWYQIHVAAAKITPSVAMVLRQVPYLIRLKDGRKVAIAMAAIFLAAETGKYINSPILQEVVGNWLGKSLLISMEQLPQFSGAEV